MCAFVFLLFVSCKERAEVYDLAICGSYAVPGMFCSDLKGDAVSCEVLDRDSYGRVLFTYKTESSITGLEEEAYVICQKYDANYVYFYEDIGYSFAEDYENDSTYLKEMNDWGKPLDENKLSRRQNAITLDLCIARDTIIDRRWSETQELCAAALHTDSSAIEPYGFVDYDGTGKELLLIAQNTDSLKLYFALLHTNDTVSVLEVAGRTVDQNELTNWKLENDWKYGLK